MEIIFHWLTNVAADSHAVQQEWYARELIACFCELKYYL